MIFSSVLFWWPYSNQSRKRKGTDICSETDIFVGVVDLPLSGWSAVSHYTIRCETEHCYSCFTVHNNSCLRVCLVSQYAIISAFILTSVILLNSPLNYSHMQQQANWATQTPRGKFVVTDSTKLPVQPIVASTEQHVCTQCLIYLC